MPQAIARIAALFVLLSLGACTGLSSLEPPEVQVTSLEMLAPAPGALEQRFAVGLRLVNPNNRGISIDGLDFELEVNGQRLARGVTNRAFELPPLGEAETSVVVTTSVFDILRQAVQLSERLEQTLDYRLRGRLHLGSGFVRTVPFDRSGKLTP